LETESVQFKIVKLVNGVPEEFSDEEKKLLVYEFKLNDTP
jgi:hypothetical protein